MHFTLPGKMRGNAIAEVIGAMMAIAPFLIGIPLLGKQFDVKHKVLDAARYAAWERTVWRNEGTTNRKAEEQIALELRDRILGHPAAGLIAAGSMAEVGVSANPLWHDAHQQRLVADIGGDVPISFEEKAQSAPGEVGYLLVPGLAHGRGSSKAIEAALGVSDLRLGSRAFSQEHVTLSLRNILVHNRDAEEPKATQSSPDERGTPLAMTAGAAILSDAWSARDENNLRRRVDDLTTNELIESLEFAGQVIASQASGKGKPLYGEGQFAAHPDLRPTSSTLPAAYVPRK